MSDPRQQRPRSEDHFKRSSPTVIVDVETVVLVTADTLRYDALFGDDGPPRAAGVGEVTGSDYPFLEGLANRGMVFSNAYSTGPGTSSAFPGLLASAYPLDHGYRGLNDGHVAVVEQLSAAGIRTVGVTSSSHASSLFQYDLGFDVFYDNPSYRRNAVDTSSLSAPRRLKNRLFDAARSVPIVDRVGATALETVRSLRGGDGGPPYERAEAVTDRAIALLDEDHAAEPNRNRFVWIHYMEPHAPYYPPDEIVAAADTGDVTREFANEVWEKWKADRPPLWTGDGADRFTDRERRALELFYRVQIKYLDRELERLYEFLDAEFGFKRTALVFTSDHGEEFFEHGDLGHRAKVYDELVHVPLVAYSEAFDARTVEETVSHVDVGPTVADLLGRQPAEQWRGRSLRPLLGGDDRDGHDYVLSEVCHSSGYGGDVEPEMAVLGVVTDDWKYVRNEQTDEENLYPRDTAETEEHDRIDDPGTPVDELREVTTERLSSVDDKEVDREELSEDLREQLHQLGYIHE